MSTPAPTVRRQTPRVSPLQFTAPSLAQQIALLSGANRKQGFAVARQLAATGMTAQQGSPELAPAERAARQLRLEGGDLTAVQLDVTRQADVDDRARVIESTYGRVDVPVNNAGAYDDVSEVPSSVSIDAVQAALEINLLGA